MDKHICRECQHYRQHYLLDYDAAMPVNCGHCIFPRLKKRKPQASACQYFLSCANTVDLPDRDGTIQFLSTECLQRILKLPLPPTIREEIMLDWENG